MRPIVIVLIVVALVLAGGAAFLGSKIMSRKPEVIVEQAPTETQILVAARDLPAGEIIQDDGLAWRPWPEDGIQPEYILRPSESAGFGDFPGSAMRIGVRAGEPLTADRVFKRGEAGFLAGALGPGLRAISVRVDDVSGTSGFVLPGDRVDVIMTQNFTEFDPQTESSVERHVVQTVLENVRVLAVDQVTNDVEETAKSAKTVTMEVTPVQGEIVALAEEMGNLTLSLRSLTKGEEPALQPFQADYNVSRYLGRNVKTSNRILIAARDLPAGTLLRDQDLDWASVPARDLAAGYYIEGAADLERLRGALVYGDVAKGTVLLGSHLIFPDEDNFLISVLGPDMRGYSIPITPQSIVSGRLSAGDRVDVIMTTTVAERGGLLPTRTFSETIIQNARLVAIDRVYDRDTARWILGQTATLEVPAKGAEVLAAAQSMGTLTLALRTGDGAPKPGQAFTTDFEVSRAMTAYVWGQTVPLPPGLEDSSEDEVVPDDGSVAVPTQPALPQLAPIPAPTLAPLSAEPSAEPSTGLPTAGGAAAQAEERSVKVYRGGGETIYEFTE
ncbi:MAG: Flp pilus assembly protein CpaB [Alphaproteobacteria bacterium]